MSRERELLERAYQYIPLSSITSQEIRAYLADTNPSETINSQEVDRSQQLEKGCARSHPHEDMDEICKLKTVIARLENENCRLRHEMPKQDEPVGNADTLPEQDEEPIGYTSSDSLFKLKNGAMAVFGPAKSEFMYTPLYLHSAPRKPFVRLSEEEIFELLFQVDPLTKRLPPGFKMFAQAIEDALEEKNK